MAAHAYGPWKIEPYTLPAVALTPPRRRWRGQDRPKPPAALTPRTFGTLFFSRHHSLEDVKANAAKWLIVRELTMPFTSKTRRQGQEAKEPWSHPVPLWGSVLTRAPISWGRLARRRGEEHVALSSALPSLHRYSQRYESTTITCEVRHDRQRWSSW